MMINNIRIWILVILVSVFALRIRCHSWMTSPVSRKQYALSGSNQNNYNCNPKDFGKAGIASYTRGESLKIEWLGNNHLAGFVQLAIAPRAQSGNPGIFQKRENIVMISCYRPKSCPRTGPEFGKTSPHCTQTMTIPKHLRDGEYTLQWVQYGSGDSNGHPKESLPDYVSCHDFRIKGGAIGSANKCPTFFGGDISGAGVGECSFYTSNHIGNNNIINVNDAKNLKKGPPKYLENCA